MRTSLVRTGSVPVQKPVLTGSPQASLSRQTSVAGDKIYVYSPRFSLHFHYNGRRDTPAKPINKALSEGAIRSATESFGAHRKLNLTGTRSFPASIPDEEEFLSDSEGRNAIRKSSYIGVWPEAGIPLVELGFSGGVGDGGDHGTATVTGGDGGDRIRIGAYYEEMLKSNPTNALLLRNYGKFLHEVEKDMARAEEYYGRAILANPGDGELLSLYGKLIWETQRDEDRAKSYFDQAIHAAPDDCMVLGSYAHFMWEAEEEEEEENTGGIEEENRGGIKGTAEPPAAGLIAAF